MLRYVHLCACVCSDARVHVFRRVCCGECVVYGVR